MLLNTSYSHDAKNAHTTAINIPPAPRGIPQIEVTFDIDANGIVHVTAKDLGTGKEQKVTITSGTNLSEEEIERKVKEAEMNAEADKQKKDKIEALNQADSTIYQTEKTLNELGDKVSADDKSQIESAIANLKEVKENIEKLLETYKTGAKYKNGVYIRKSSVMLDLNAKLKDDGC